MHFVNIAALLLAITTSSRHNSRCIEVLCNCFVLKRVPFLEMLIKIENR